MGQYPCDAQIVNACFRGSAVAVRATSRLGVGFST